MGQRLTSKSYRAKLLNFRERTQRNTTLQLNSCYSMTMRLIRANQWQENQAMALDEQATKSDFADLTAGIVSSYVSNNSVRLSELASLIAGVHRALTNSHAGTVESKQEPLTPAVNPKRSVHPDYIVCLEGREEVQVTETTPAHPLRPLAGAVPRKMG